MFADNRGNEACYYSERLVSEDLDWAVLSSFRLGAGCVPMPIDIKEEVGPGPIDRFGHLADFPEAVYREGRRATVDKWQAAIEAVSKDSAGEARVHYERLLGFFSEVTAEGVPGRRQMVGYKPGESVNYKLLPFALQPSRLKDLPKLEPQKHWPGSLKDLLVRLKGLPPLALWFEPFYQKYELFGKIVGFIETHVS